MNLQQINKRLAAAEIERAELCARPEVQYEGQTRAVRRGNKTRAIAGVNARIRELKRLAEHERAVWSDQPWTRDRAGVAAAAGGAL